MIPQKIEMLQKELDVAVKSLSKTGFNYAKAYEDYRIKLAKKLVELKEGGMPVTIAYDIARGDEEVAQAKFTEIASEAVYKANLEAINSIKLNIKVLINQYDKEWGQAGNNNID